MKNEQNNHSAQNNSKSSALSRIFPVVVRYIIPALLTLIVGLLCFANFTPNTWLTGWDNLHPEFDFALNFKRAFYSAWQEYQGLGLLAGMAHAADLFRTLFLWGISFILPDQLIRYFYHFLMILVGTLGAYQLVKYIIPDTFSPTIKRSSALVGALFYLLNLGSVQYFFFLFEPFSTFWGLLPWEIFVLLAYFHKPTPKKLLILGLVNLIATGQAYVQTIFFVYIIILSFFSIHHLITSFGAKAIRIILAAALTIIMVNSFWLLPNAYFFTQDVSVTQESINNKINSDRFFEMNKQRGSIPDLITLKGFNYDTLVTGPSGESEFAMNAWHTHYDSWPIISINIILFVLMLYGITRKFRYRGPFFGLFVLGGIVFLSDTIFFDSASSIFRIVPFFSQIFRNPFSKFIVPLVLTMSVGIAVGTAYIFNFLSKRFFLAFQYGVLGIALCVLFIGYPAFTGQYIYTGLRIQIPKEYFQTFDYFKAQNPDSRIMNLPQTSFWGWGSYRWGSTGSGFLWYGIEQPIMDRAFDVWSDELEQYYWELTYALKSRDQAQFDQIIEKYHISYILFDESYIPSESSNPKALYKQEDFLKNNPNISLVASYGSIHIYKTNLKAPEGFAYLATGGVTASKGERFVQRDQLFAKTGLYYQPEDSMLTDLYYPFPSLFTNRFQEDVDFQVDSNAKNISFSNNVPAGNYVLTVPKGQSSNVVPVHIRARIDNNVLNLELQYIPTEVSIGSEKINIPTSSETLEIPVPTDAISFILDINHTAYFSLDKLSDQYKDIGGTYLHDSGIPMRAYIHNASRVIEQVLDPAKFIPATSCIESTDGTVRSDIVGGAINISARRIPACLPYQEVLDFLPRFGLAEVIIEYHSKSDAFPRYCLHSKLQDQCLSNKDVLRGDMIQIADTVKSYVPITTTQDDTLSFSLVLDAGLGYAQDYESTKSIKINRVLVRGYELVGDTQISLEPLKDLSDDLYQVTIPEKTAIIVSVPKLSSPWTFDELIMPGVIRLGDIGKDDQHTGDIYSRFVGEDADRRLQLYARDALLNQWMNLDGVPSDISYMIELEHTNYEGLPPLISVETLDANTRFLYAQLEPRSNLILPPIYAFDTGLRISLQNPSFSTDPTINEFTHGSLQPIPYEIVTEIHLNKADLTVQRPIFDEINYTKNSYTSYTFKLPDTIPDNTMIVLSQSHDKGWNAYSVNCESSNLKCQISNFFPMIFGAQLNDHVRVNGWSNGWLLNDQLTSNLQNPTSSMIVLMYIPQYLEYLGLILLFISLITLTTRSIIVRKE
ncbi:hypothetical protein COY16_04110 [Candidatus Roizmanbacteria bacterium CG_4_10_14_0_2_um_filter_39_13]|uniref:Membrane protein 6-pyruvoyl-tetrahydropterin synthase-related domain-containing protein n=1 Tax=Candidatus Roizmanbacteria bacterium CG_4_10_14_0_2_um_filter_39_13 TaxID=1974825 RepID=A0A2M7TXG9_9BACT|nr:MAG: hypothetical protein COY16_04110 [Candidatus Roizmanbacteria bacterium CG_4_10_14_0_2_um_filter_39_13]